MSPVIEREQVEVDEPVPDNDVLYEVVDGKVVELPLIGAFEVLLGSFLNTQLDTAARAGGYGISVSEMLFELQPGLCRRPDVAFVSEQSWPRTRTMRRGAAWSVVPDIPIEVVSPSNTFEEIERKTREYLAAGAVEVWVVLAIERRIYVHRSPRQVDVLTETDTLTAGDLIPGFALPLEQLFGIPVEHHELPSDE